MPRALRVQAPGAQYHITSSGNTARKLFRDDNERVDFLDMVGDVVAGRGWRCRSYCLLSTHYHLLIETPESDLAAGMQYLNGRYGQKANWRRGENGHVFRARYYSALVEGDGHRLELYRYIALNPVRAGLVKNPEDWRWSSYGALLELAPSPSFLDVAGALQDFAESTDRARTRLRMFIANGLGSQE
jgi:REP element-mobilizing transposase RayT